MRAARTPTDEQLLAKHLEGEPHVFELLVRRHSEELYRFVLRFTNSSAGADDVVQDAFLQAYVSADRFDPTRRFKPWLYTIAANKARDWLRSRARRSEVPLDAEIGGDQGGQKYLELFSSDGDDLSAQLDEAEQRRFVRRIVEDMPQTLREVLILAYYHRFPYKEIADILGIPVGTVKSRLHSAVGHFGQAYRAAANAAVGRGSDEG